ncbi:hypothetical protein [Acidithiobacillus ferrooxidans]|uniref:hypothetical protein n=1 Tax=Acidithiobacillus ferrooxidans TaxID=920 RepID=UPI0013D0C2CE|nr:hypothetical protein [Acidithiobacillus ferrooxidans]
MILLCMSSVTNRHSADAAQKVLRPASILLFTMVILAVVAGIAWSYGWNGRLEFQHSNANGVARIQSAGLLLKSGQFMAAREQLAPIITDPRDPAYRQAEIMLWHIDWTHAMAEPAGSLAREQARKILIKRLTMLLGEGAWSTKEYQQFAEDAQKIGAYDLSAEAWLSVARVSPKSARQAMDAVAAAWTANGESVQAGRLLLQMAIHSSDPVFQHADFLRGIALIQGGGGARLALSLGEKALLQMPELRKDHDILLFMARLALSAGQPELAAKWLKAELERRASGKQP